MNKERIGSGRRVVQAPVQHGHHGGGRQLPPYAPCFSITPLTPGVLLYASGTRLDAFRLLNPTAAKAFLSRRTSIAAIANGSMQPSPSSIAKVVSSRYTCRSRQVQQLALLLAPLSPSPQAIVLYGLPSTGKTSVLRTLLSQTTGEHPHVIIPCKECITTRHLLERTVADVLDSLIHFEQQRSDVATVNNDASLDGGKYTRTENYAALVAHLERLLAHRVEKFILAFDSVDTLTESPGTLLPALVRLGECIPNLTVVFTLITPSPGIFHRSGINYVHFPAYTRDEALTILSHTPLPIDPSSTPDSQPDSDSIWLWTHFTTAVWDSLSSIAGNDIPSFHTLCQNLWPTFTEPIRSGKYKPREFSRLMIAQRALFQKDDALTSMSTITMSNPPPTSHTTTTTTTDPTLPETAIHLLCASYLASHNPPRTDTIHFSEWSERKRRRRKRGPAKRTALSQHRHIPRQQLPPAPFTLQRLLAIHSAIYPHPVTTKAHPAAVPEAAQTDVLTAIATLTESRLLVRSAGSGDPLDEAARWRVNVGWEVVVALGREAGVEMGDWVAE